MKIVLLERVGKLGGIGDVVTVKNGYARNSLLPDGKALRATKENLAYFEKQKAKLEADNLAKRKEADKTAEKLNQHVVNVIRQASEGGQLYGSVTARDIAESITQSGITVTRGQVDLNQSIKTLGLFSISIVLHPEVTLSVTLNVARSLEEAEIQLERGAALIGEESDSKEPQESKEEAALEEDKQVTVQDDAKKSGDR